MSLAQQIAARMLAGRKPTTSIKAPTQLASGVARTAIDAHKPAQDAAATGIRIARSGQLTSETSANFQRVVSSPPRHRSAAYNPPRREEPDITALVEAFAPPPVTPPLPASVISLGWKGSCKAIDAATGRTCKLPAHPGDVHGSERGPFIRVAAPGTTSFPLREALDQAALAGVVDADRPSDRQIKRESRERIKAGIRLRAHNGDTTSTGIKSIDTNPNHEAA